MAKLNRRTILHRGGLALLCNRTRATDGSPLDTGTSEIRPVIERYEVQRETRIISGEEVARYAWSKWVPFAKVPV
jgi:hypothetical protein